MNVEEMLEIVGSFIAGFGNRSSLDVNNAVYIAMEVQSLDLPLVFEEAERLGVESTRLYGILRKAKPKRKYYKAFNIGRNLANFSSHELMLMALYLWNEGRNSLSKEEKEKALSLLENKFNTKAKEGRFLKSSSATASG